MFTDTIVAIVTPPGEGGVGIVRASGPESPALPGRLFPGLRSPWASHRLRQGTLVDPRSGTAIDQAVACLMCAPRSYTGEDVFEIHCHGNPLLLERVVGLCLDLGCRPARPGEFTLRAFLQGRMDLTQAEAVLDVVRARTNAGLVAAAQQLSGWLGGQIEPLRQELLGVLAHVEALIDFVEEDIPPQAGAETVAAVRRAAERIAELGRSVEGGALLREGATLAIVGKPNAGKSSLMNALLGMDRSIVTPIAGTTRDTVEERIDLGGVPVRAVDTAGITASTDEVERIGVERSRQAVAGADLILVVLDRSRPWSERDEMVAEAIAAAADEQQPRVVIALNKTDLPAVLDERTALARFDAVTAIPTSAVHADGLDDLRAALAGAIIGTHRGEWIGGNTRHRDALIRAEEALRAALTALDGPVPLDLISFDLRAAVAALGEITGATVDDELLDRIFRDFCIGK